MIVAEFQKDGAGHFVAYRCAGHSGLASKGKDIVCAAFSSMTNLLLAFSEGHADLEVDNKDNVVTLSLGSDLPDDERRFVDRAFAIVYDEMSAIAGKYPKNAVVLLQEAH